jgi:hypothetical protein
MECLKPKLRSTIVTKGFLVHYMSLNLKQLITFVLLVKNIRKKLLLATNLALVIVKWERDDGMEWNQHKHDDNQDLDYNLK